MNRLTSRTIKGTLALAFAVLFSAAMIRHWRPVEPTVGFQAQWFESLNVGKALVETGTWAHPFKTLDTGPTAHLAPLFPLVSAALLFDSPSDAVLLRRLLRLETLMLACLCGLLPVVANATGMGWQTGMWAGAAMALLPLGRAPEWESNLAAVLLALVTIASLHWWRHRDSWFATALAVAAWSAAIQANANSLLVLNAFLLCAAATRQSSRTALILFALCVTTLAPWTLRNARALGSIVPVRSNLGLELAVSNNSCAEVRFSANLVSGCFGRYHPNESEAEAREFARAGEVAYNRERLRRAAGWIVANPSRFLELTVTRTFLFWIPSLSEKTDGALSYPPNTMYIVALRLATVVSLLGLWWLWRANRAAAVWFGVWLTCFPLVYYVVQFDYRYRYPITWMTFLLSAYTLTGRPRNRGANQATTIAS